jgi:hypothetical protein
LIDINVPYMLMGVFGVAVVGLFGSVFCDFLDKKL